VRLIARLPRLCAFGVGVPYGAHGADLLRPLSDAPALTDLSVNFKDWLAPDTAPLNAISGCAGLRRLEVHRLSFPSGTFIGLCSSSTLRQLQHLELADCYAAAAWIGNVQPCGAAEFESAFIALGRLRSLALENVRGVDLLLPHLRHTPTLHLLSIRCEPSGFGIGAAQSPLPSHAVLRALLTAAPQLEVRLLVPATLERWLAVGQSAGGGVAVFEQQWRELQSVAAELDRVTVVNWEPPSA
jgi:hypothetical protein